MKKPALLGAGGVGYGRGMSDVLSGLGIALAALFVLAAPIGAVGKLLFYVLLWGWNLW